MFRHRHIAHLHVRLAAGHAVRQFRSAARCVCALISSCTSSPGRCPWSWTAGCMAASMHAYAAEQAGADGVRADSPIEMHRDDRETDAQQSGSGKSEPSGSGLPSSSERAAPVQQVAQLMGRRLKIGVKDGRVLEGDLHCLDKLGNIIMNNTSQLAHGDGSSKQHHMGLVLVPHEQRYSCQLLVMPGESEQISEMLTA